MNESDERAEAEEVEPEASETPETAEESRPTAGPRRRKKLAGLLDEDSRLSEQIELLVGDRDARHRLILRGPRITRFGGPARQVLELADQLRRSLEDVFPGIDPFLEALTPTGSFEVFFYAPQAEINAAAERKSQLGDDDPGALALPDTAIAVAALSSVLTKDDPQEAASAARALGTNAADGIRALTAALADTSVDLDFTHVYPGIEDEAHLTPQGALRITEQLDAEEEIPLVTVDVAGVLQGVNSGGDGTFEIVLAEDQTLDPALGPRRKPGDKISGSLSPGARRAIKDGALWDTHVTASVQVTRRQRGRSIRVEGFRLMAVQARYH